MNRRNVILGGLATLGVGGWFAASSFGSAPLGSTALTPFVGAANAQTTEGEVDTSGITEMVLGDENAPVTMVEYASFTCPHCATFHNDTFKKLKADYIDSGKVKFIYREVYFKSISTATVSGLPWWRAAAVKRSSLASPT